MLTHRGTAIKEALQRRRAIRRARRNRKLRYRKPRWGNRKKPKGWLAPSLRSRLDNTITWVQHLLRSCPIAAVSQELVKFDTQLLHNPEIAGREYQQGTLYGYEVREYVLEKWGRTCAYCGTTTVPLEVEHILCKARGGTNRVSNLTLACEPCNKNKGTMLVQDFLREKPDVLKRMLAQAKAPLKDAAAVNSTRWALYERLHALGLPLEVGTGRKRQNIIVSPEICQKPIGLMRLALVQVRQICCASIMCIPCSFKRTEEAVGRCAEWINMGFLALAQNNRSVSMGFKRAIW